MHEETRTLLAHASSGLVGPEGRLRFDLRVLACVVERARAQVLDRHADPAQLKGLLKLVAVLRDGRGPVAAQQLQDALRDCPEVVEHLRAQRGTGRAAQRRRQAAAALGAGRWRAPRVDDAAPKGTIPLHRFRPAVQARSPMSRRMTR
ncbi:MAG: hypothetical protein RMA76_10030 [Deltaproteobacteria bacterium]